MKPHSTPLVALSVVALVSASMAACGGSSGSTGSNSACTGGASSPKPESQVVLAGSAGTTEKAFLEALQPWSTKAGVKINYLEGTSASNFAKVQAGAQAHNQTIDIVNNNDTTTAQGVGQGLWAKVDKCIATNTSQLDQTLAFPKEIVGTAPYGVRIFVTLTGIVYNTQVFQKNGWAPPTSWLDLFDTKYANCLIILTPTAGVPYIPMLNYLTTQDFANDSQTIARFSKMAKTIPAFAGSVAQSLQFLQQGTGCIAPSLQSRVIDLATQGAPLAFVHPKEGDAFLGGTLTISKDGPNPIAAQQLLNELISAASMQLIFEKAFLVSTNLKVTKPATGVASKLAVASEFKSLGLKEIPLSAYASQDQWTRDLAALAAK